MQEACEAVEVLGKRYVGSSLAQPQSSLQDLKEYFRRPYPITNGLFSLGTLGSVYAVNFNRSTFADTFFPTAAVRLQGVAGIRFKLVVTLQVNSTPFQQGLAVLSWQYNATETDAVTFPRHKNSGTCTNIPHVKLDIAETSMVRLVIPFLHTREYFPVTYDEDAPSDWHYGVIGLTTALPIRAGAAATAPSYRIMLHLEELELIGAAPVDTDAITLQSGKPIEKEFLNDAYPISSAVHSAANTLKWIAKGVPALSSLAATPIWALGRAAGAIRYFGFSKPQIQDPIVRMNNNFSVCEQNVDVPSSTIMAGPMASNYLKVSPEFACTDVDEMALAYVLSQWGQLRVGSISTSNTQGSRVYVCPLSPDCMWYRSTSAGGAPFCNISSPTYGLASYNAFVPTHLHYFASMFKQWRGDFQFRFTFAKTKFHAGRVVVQFTPYNNGAFSLPFSSVRAAKALTTGPQLFGYSAIFDLRDGNEFTFDVPFVSEFPYLEFFESMGTLTMSIQDPLLSPSTVSDAIDFLVEVRAKPGFELACPTAIIHPAAQGSSVTLQSGKMIATNAGAADELCVGERINSLKQLIMLPKLSTTTVAAGATFNGIVMPWYYHPLLPNTGSSSAPAAYRNESFSFSGNIAKCYAFVRGGTDVHVQSSLEPNMFIHGFQGSLMGNTQVAEPKRNRSGSVIPRVINFNRQAHIRYPAYQRTARIAANCLDTIDWKMTTPGPTFSGARETPFYLPRLTVSNANATATTLFLGRCAADDAMLGHYIGPPPCCLVLTGGNLTWDPDSATIYQSAPFFHKNAVCLPTGTVIQTDIRSVQTFPMDKPCFAVIPGVTYDPVGPFGAGPLEISTFQSQGDPLPEAPKIQINDSDLHPQTITERMYSNYHPPTDGLRRSASGRLTPSRVRTSGDQGVSPSILAGRLTGITQTLPGMLHGVAALAGAAADIANATR